MDISTLYEPVHQSIIDRLGKIRLLVCDVDGVFSDGRIYMGNHGEEYKAFHTRDGFGIKAVSTLPFILSPIACQNRERWKIYIIVL